MTDVVIVDNKQKLLELYRCSAMTWEGLRQEDWQLAASECGVEGCKIYVTKGLVMNTICGLTDDNAYPEDLNIVSLDKYKGLAMMVGARWMDDIIDNNARHQGWHPFDNMPQDEEEEDDNHDDER